MNSNAQTQEGVLLNEGLRICKRSLVAVGVFSCVANLLMLVPAFFMLNVYDKAVGYNSTATLWVLSGITLFLFCVLAAMEILRSRVLVAIASRLDHYFSPRLYRAVFRSALLAGGHRAGIQPLLDLQNLRQFVTGQAIFAIFDAPWLPIYLLVLFMFHPLLGWMGVISALVFAALTYANQHWGSAALADANRIARETNADTQRNLRNAEVVDVLGMLPEIEARWRARQDQLLFKQEESSHQAGIFTGITKTLRMAVQSAAIAAGAYLVLLQEISPGMIIAGSILIGRALQPVELAMGSWRGFVSAREQYERLAQLFEELPTPSPRMSLPPIEGGVAAKHATVCPPGSSKPSLINISFLLPPGNVCMIMGASGAGKSSLVRAILGVWPTTSGEFRLDGTEPVNFDRAWFGPQIGYLPQGIELLEGTISSNIARFSQVEPDAVVQAARDAAVHDFILSLENGYDTEIGKGANQLSPGQMQRIGLARALYNRPKLVVLDEPNSNLDEAGDQALSGAINLLKERGSTVLIVSHRQSILPLADYLLIMTEGQLSEFGPKSEVIARVSGSTSQRAELSAPQPKVSTANYRAISWGDEDEA